MIENENIELWNARISHWPIPARVKERLKKYADDLANQELPVFFEFTHMADTFALPSEMLADMVNRTDRFYRTYRMPKKRGGKRKISIPSPSLLDIQRLILREILSRVELHDSAYGFVENRSIIKNAKEHLGARCLLKIDIKDFFPSIKIQRIISVFNYFGYAPNISYYLARLCCLDDCLPQGAATSPYLSNIVAKRLDIRMTALANKMDLNYTRYADDITISGQDISYNLVHTLQSILASEGFAINSKKTVIVKGAGKKTVTGISISGKKLSLPKKYTREIRKQIHFIQKFGIESHMERVDDFDPIYLDRLRGKVNFWLQVEPDNEFAKYSLQVLEKEEENVADLVL